MESLPSERPSPSRRATTLFVLFFLIGLETSVIFSYFYFIKTMFFPIFPIFPNLGELGRRHGGVEGSNPSPKNRKNRKNRKKRYFYKLKIGKNDRSFQTNKEK